MSKLKVMTIAGTRPELIRLCEIIRKFDLYFEHIFVHTGQNYDYSLNKIFFEELSIREPDYYLNVVGKDLGETMGNVIASSYALMEKERPDALLILGDTNSALCAIPAKRLKIPIFHMEAGNRCFDLNVPEEINRRIVDHISDVNMPYTENARRYLIDEGIGRERVYVTGSPMREVINKYRDRIEASDALSRLGLERGKYFLVSAHREENIDNEENFLSLMNALNGIAEKYGMPVIYSTHPRSKKTIEKHGFKFHPLVRSMEPFGFFDYNALQLGSYCVLSDSGTLAEEAAILGFAGVLIRTSTERPEAFDRGALIIGGVTQQDIVSAVETAVSMKKNGETVSETPDYGDVNVSAKVVKLVESYAKIVDRFVWRK